MKLTNMYPVLMADNLTLMANFYVNTLGMELTFQSDWYLSLKIDGKEGTFQMAILKSGHSSIPDGYGEKTKGTLLNFEVEKASKIYKVLIGEEKMPIHLDLRDEPWGQRHFITSDPENNLLDIIELIEPSEEFLAQYTEGLQ